MESDAELVRRVRAGEVEAFGALCRRYEKTLLAAVLADVREVHVAEDIVQQALLRAFERISTLRSADKFGPWLMTIARREAVNAIRSRRQLMSAAVDHAAIDEPTSVAGDFPFDQEQLLHLVARLPEQERILIGLRYFDGHELSKVAAMTGRPLGTVTKQLSRAIARLRSWWPVET